MQKVDLKKAEDTMKLMNIHEYLQQLISENKFQKEVALPDLQVSMKNISTRVYFLWSLRDFIFDDRSLQIKKICFTDLPNVYFQEQCSSHLCLWILPAWINYQTKQLKAILSLDFIVIFRDSRYKQIFQLFYRMQK